jgi:hypothetical protein
VAIPPSALPGVLKALRDKVAEAAPPTVMAMAGTYKDHVQKVTLRRSFAAPGQFGTPASPGSPPAWRTGELAKSIRVAPGVQSGLVATASVAPHVIYAATQEHGGVHYARQARYMHWINSGGEWWKKRVDIPARPYMAPAVRECIEDGSLTKSAMETFMVVVWG